MRRRSWGVCSEEGSRRSRSSWYRPECPGTRGKAAGSNDGDLSGLHRPSPRGGVSTPPPYLQGIWARVDWVSVGVSGGWLGSIGGQLGVRMPGSKPWRGPSASAPVLIGHPRSSPPVRLRAQGRDTSLPGWPFTGRSIPPFGPPRFSVGPGCSRSLLYLLVGTVFLLGV